MNGWVVMVAETVILAIVGLIWVLLFVYLKQRHDTVLEAQGKSIKLQQQVVEQQRQLIELIEQLISVNWDANRGENPGPRPRKVVG